MNTRIIIKLVKIFFFLFLAPALSANDIFFSSYGSWTSGISGRLTVLQLNNENKTFAFDIPHKDYKFSGSYRVEGSSLNYTAADGKDLTDETSLKGKKGVCKAAKINDELIFQEELKCTGPLGKFRLFGRTLPEDTVRKVNGIEVLTLTRRGGTIGKTALHTAPNVSAKPLSCTVWDDDGKKVYEGKSLKADTPVFAIAISKQSSKNDWDNMWIYIDASTIYENSCGPGWVQGKFLRVHHGG